MTGFIEVRTTTSEREDADKIAEGIVRDKLAACVQVIGPISSTYRWKDGIETEDEFLLLIKTRSDLFPDVRMFIEENHPYEVPEIISVPITGSSGPYLEWMEENIVG
ncbi:MAG: divalent-cation tolerance protein CutA [Thermoplasmatota archaeon]